MAAILGQQGKRVLVIDLDFQRSLSRLCFSNEKIKAIHEEKRTLQHFLLDPHADAARLLRCTSPLGHADGCDIVINAEALQVKDASDSLEDAEMHLQAEWLMNPKGADVRFLLRKALHAPAVRERYNFVLLDCPPRLSTACINALAASDFALIPVMLDKLSAVSAPNLLRKLNQLRFNKILAPLNILGIVANRVEFYSAKPIKSQAAEWDELIVPCREAWGQAEHFFDTKIKQSSAFARAAERQTFAAFTDEFKPVFSDLLDELEARITHESSRAATVSA